MRPATAAGRAATTGGLAVAVVSAATFGTAGSFADGLMGSGWSPAGAVLARVGFAALLLTPVGVSRMRGRWSALRQAWPAVAAYGVVAIAACQLCYFNAVEHLSVGVALLLEYSAAVLVVLWMWFRHRLPPSRRTASGAVLAVAGLVLVLGVTGQQHVDAAGLAWGLGAAASLTVYFVVSARADHPLPPVALAWSGMVLATAVLALAGAVGVVPLHTSAASTQLAGHAVAWYVPVLGLAVVAGAVAYATGIAAARRLGARVASFVGLAEVLFAVVFAWLLVGQRPGAMQLVGGVVVLAGIALVRAGERAPDPAPEPLPEPGRL